MSDQIKGLSNGGNRVLEGRRDTLFVKEIREAMEITVPDPAYEPSEQEMKQRVFLPVAGATMEERIDGLARILFQSIRIKQDS